MAPTISSAELGDEEWVNFANRFAKTPFFLSVPAINSAGLTKVLTNAIYTIRVQGYAVGLAMIALGGYLGVKHGDWGWAIGLALTGAVVLYVVLAFEDINRMSVDPQKNELVIRFGRLPFAKTLTLELNAFVISWDASASSVVLKPIRKGPLAILFSPPLDIPGVREEAEMVVESLTEANNSVKVNRTRTSAGRSLG